IPVEILNMDDRSIQLFEDALKDGKETVYSIRIMVVGHVGVGKTTLVKRLLGDEVNISERRSTEGIDVYVNCCDVSLSTCEWTRRDKDSEQDYEIQRLVKVLNENYQMSGSVADQEQDAISPQQKTMDQNLIGIVAEYDKNKEVLDQRSQQNISHNLSSTASHPKESPSTDVQRNHTIPENNTIPGREPGENIAIESHKRDPLREMLQVVKENPDKLKQDVRKYARLTILDFAGQYSFYTTHQMFLTRRAIYLMVLNVSEQITDDVEDDCYLDTAGKIKCKVQELLEIWMNSIHSCARSDKEGVNPANSPDSSLSSVIPPPVILVGTHIDQIRKRQSVIRAEKYKLPPKMQAGMVTLTTTSTPDHSGEQLTLSSVQESSQTSTESLQRKRRATEPVSSIQKRVTCANPKLLYQVLYNATQGALSNRCTLERNCQNVGLQFHGETPGNGNCFFEAVSSQLQRLKYPVQLSPQQLRQDAVAFLKDNQLLQVSDGYIDLAEFMYNESFEEYCARMAEDGEWADHVLVVAMARTLQRDIMIVTSAPASGNDDNVAWVVGQDNFQGDPILLGHIWEHHYESLEPTDSTELEVKCQRQAVEKMGFEANDTKNQMDMFGKYGGQSAFLGASAYNQDTINPIQVPMSIENDVDVATTVIGLARYSDDYTRSAGPSMMFAKDITNNADHIQFIKALSPHGTLSAEQQHASNPTRRAKPAGENPLDIMREDSLDPEVSLDSEDFLDSEDSLNPFADFDPDYQMKKHRKLGQKYLREIRSYLSDKPTIVHLVDKDFAIDNTIDDDELEKLKRTIFEVASQQPYWGEQIPTRWFLLEQQLIKRRDAGVKVIPRSDVEELNNEGTVQIKDNEEMDLFLKYLHETGTIIYFSIEVLRDNIILDPIWLIDALKLLINAHPILPKSPAENESQSDSPADSAIGQKWRDFKEKGVLSPDLVDALWTKEKYPQLHANKDHLLRVMEQFNIIAKPRSFSENGENKNLNMIPPTIGGVCQHFKYPFVILYTQASDLKQIAVSHFCLNILKIKRN
ncbi:hypothetical protein ACJMK2_001839, partial [Sinanodonta woodiana]